LWLVCGVDTGEVAGLRRELAGAQMLLSLFRTQALHSHERIAELEADNARLCDDNERLGGRVEEARRAGKRQAAPFSRGQKKTDPARAGRKPGEGYGRKARRVPPAPERVDEQVDVPLPACCPDCGDRVELDKVVEQFQEELVPAHTRVRRYDVALGRCTGCRRRVRGRHVDQTSDALGAAGVMLGPRAHALAAWLHVGLGVPMAKVSKILAELGGLSVTPGGLHSALHKTAGDAESTYQALLEALHGSRAVAADETGWRIDAERNWLWVFVGDQVTVYHIAAGRGYGQAADILGDEFAGVLERDGWASYRKFTHASHQTCLAHLLRRCHELIADAGGDQERTEVPAELRAILLDALCVRAQQLDGDALDSAVAGLRARVETFCARTPGADPDRRLVKHVTTEKDHLFTFLTTPGVEATNWEAEQALRGMVVARKHWGGNKTRKGADTAAILASVLRTAAQQSVDPIDVLAELQRNGQIPTPLELADAGHDP
jgi:transposase